MPHPIPPRNLSLPTRIASLWILAFILPTAHSAAAQDAIRYRISFPDPAAHLAEIQLTAPTNHADAIEFFIPVWSPGFYRVEDHAAKIRNFSARSPQNAPLTFDQRSPNRWRITTDRAPEVVITYRLLCDKRFVTTNWVGQDYAILNGPATFITTVDGTSLPHEVHLDLPPGWESTITGLSSVPITGHTAIAAAHDYRAPDYDTLVDCPLAAGTFNLQQFQVEGSTHLIAQIGSSDTWDGPRAASDVARIVQEHHRTWGFLPFDRYVFLLSFGPGGGGLEHRNSTLVTTNPRTMEKLGSYHGWLGLVSHEYFHAFNVKRLRPVELGPFDYENPPRTPSLWVSEGLTSYYGDLILTRAGITDEDAFLSALSSHIHHLQTSPGRLVQTLQQASEEVWNSSMSGVGGNNETSVNYYIKGPIVGFLLDARIRQATTGAKSLDDVMKSAYSQYSGRCGFTPDQFRHIAEEVSGQDLSTWFDHALRSTAELDYSAALDWFGLRFAPADDPAAPPSWRLQRRDDASPAQAQHLHDWLAGRAYEPAPPR